MVISAEQLEKEEPVKALDDEDIELMKNYVIQFFAFFCEEKVFPFFCSTLQNYL